MRRECAGRKPSCLWRKRLPVKARVLKSAFRSCGKKRTNSKAFKVTVCKWIVSVFAAASRKTGEPAGNALLSYYRPKRKGRRAILPTLSKGLGGILMHPEKDLHVMGEFVAAQRTRLPWFVRSQRQRVVFSRALGSGGDR